MSDNAVYKIVSNAVVAAIYFVVTYLSTPIAFGQIQVRIAEALILLCFFRKDFWIGLTFGCLLSNCTSPLGWPDILFGTAATLISSLLVAYASPCLLRRRYLSGYRECFRGWSRTLFHPGVTIFGSMSPMSDSAN
jgi:uncharacterized membrane protein